MILLNRRRFHVWADPLRIDAGHRATLRREVARIAPAAIDGDSWSGPVAIGVDFIVTRPPRHYTNAVTGELCNDAPAVPPLPATRLTSTVLAALNDAGIIGDHADPARVTISKRYAESGDVPGVTITIRAVSA